MSRYALALWFLMIAALGLVRFWMKLHEASMHGALRPDALRPDAWLWLVGSLLCIGVALFALYKARR